MLEDHSVIPSFAAGRCVPVSADSTIKEVRWKRQRDVSSLSGKSVRFRFQLKNGDLYSFWVSPDKSGASYGYVGAGGPGYSGSIDN